MKKVGIVACSDSQKEEYRKALYTNNFRKLRRTNSNLQGGGRGSDAGIAD